MDDRIRELETKRDAFEKEIERLKREKEAKREIKDAQEKRAKASTSDEWTLSIVQAIQNLDPSSPDAQEKLEKLNVSIVAELSNIIALSKSKQDLTEDQKVKLVKKLASLQTIHKSVSELQSLLATAAAAPNNTPPPPPPDKKLTEDTVGENEPRSIYLIRQEIAALQNEFNACQREAKERLSKHASDPVMSPEIEAEAERFVQRLQNIQSKLVSLEKEMNQAVALERSAAEARDAKLSKSTPTKLSSASSDDASDPTEDGRSDSKSFAELDEAQKGRLASLAEELQQIQARYTAIAKENSRSDGNPNDMKRLALEMVTLSERAKRVREDLAAMKSGDIAKTKSTHAQDVKEVSSAASAAKPLESGGVAKVSSSVDAGEDADEEMDASKLRTAFSLATEYVRGIESVNEKRRFLHEFFAYFDSPLKQDEASRHLLVESILQSESSTGESVDALKDGASSSLVVVSEETPRSDSDDHEARRAVETKRVVR
eukprot:g3522.t1